jgi:GDP/UDP-N,N'-diacetylbacillosamine 2-epimerase (hydrolysing)
MKTSKNKKICVITGSRAEYGLLRNTILNIKKENKFNLKLIVTGSHLSKKYGFTLNEIKKDRILITKKIDLNLISDNSIGVANSIAIGLKSFVKIFEKIKPDLILVLGDRFEILTATLASSLCRVPVCHIHGGELTEALLDDAFRHSITKMSHIHFAATQAYKKRIIQLGENPNNVFCVGGLGVDSIKKQKFLNKNTIEKKLKIKFLKNSALITFHPETLKKKTTYKNFIELLKSLKKLKNVTLIFTMPNHDIESSIIYKLIINFVKKNNNSYFFKSLGQKLYFSCCNNIDFMIGNSSSGLLEMPSFKKFTINIGDRQKGRIKAKSVINCKFENKEISKAINFVLNKKNQKFLKNIKNPYGTGGASKKIVSILKKIKIEEIINKKFFDII